MNKVIRVQRKPKIGERWSHTPDVLNFTRLSKEEARRLDPDLVNEMSANDRFFSRDGDGDWIVYTEYSIHTAIYVRDTTSIMTKYIGD